MSGLADVTTVRIPRRLLADAVEHLRRVGRRGFEGMALLAGERTGGEFQVTHTLIPAQRGIRSKNGVCVAIGPDELHRLNVWLFENSRTLVAQIHSHPTDAYHSDTDDDFPIATTVGSLSLVVPDFAARPFTLETTASYRLSAAARWEELTVDEAKRLIDITD